jgi:iron complex outermembrane receptor protein
MSEFSCSRKSLACGISRAALAAAIVVGAPAFAQTKPEDKKEEEIIVTGVHFHGPEAGSALKMPLSIKDTPQTVIAVTKDVVDFASIKKFEDFYKIDASSDTSNARDGFHRNYYRGFDQEGDNAIKVDGFRLAGNINLDLAPFERFEVVEGATSTLYGQNSIAGTLNAISKSPQDYFGGSLYGSYGSFQDRRVEGDVYGPLTKGAEFTYRLVSAFEKSNSFIDIAHSKTFVIAPSLKWQIGDNTDIIARVDYQKLNFIGDFGSGVQILRDKSEILANGVSNLEPGEAVVPNFPRHTFFSAPWAGTDKDALFSSVTFEHKFDNGWKLRANTQYSHLKDRVVASQSLFVDRNGDTVYNSVCAYDKETSVYSGEVNLFGDVHILGGDQTLFFGSDYAIQNQHELSGDTTQDYGFNAYHPDYSVYTPAFTTIESMDSFTEEKIHKIDYGLTAQAILRPVKGLTVVGGVRYSNATNRDSVRSGATSEIGDYFGAPYGVRTTKYHAVTFQTGATYALTRDLNFYASYGETFLPGFRKSFDPNNVNGRQIAPERGKAYEIGFKGNITSRLFYTFAAFDMKRTNIAQGDPGHPGFSIPFGTQSSKGVEFGVQGTILPGWELYGSTALMKSEFTDGAFAGYQSPNGPKFGVSLYSSYQLKDGFLKGLGFGGGVVHKGGRETFVRRIIYTNGKFAVIDFGNYTEVDARIFYDLKHIRVGLNVTNLTNDKHYSPTGNGGFGNSVNPPRSFKIFATTKF